MSKMIIIISTDDVLICNVCEREFSTTRQLFQHQKIKSHFVSRDCS